MCKQYRKHKKTSLLGIMVILLGFSILTNLRADPPDQVEWYAFDTHFHLTDHPIHPLCDLYFEVLFNDGSSLQQSDSSYRIGGIGSERYLAQSFVPNKEGYIDTVKLCLSSGKETTKVFIRIYEANYDNQKPDITQGVVGLGFTDSIKTKAVYAAKVVCTEPLDPIKVYIIVLSIPNANHETSAINIWGCNSDVYRGFLKTGAGPAIQGERLKAYGEPLCSTDQGSTWYIKNIGYKIGRKSAVGVAYTTQEEKWIPDRIQIPSGSQLNDPFSEPGPQIDYRIPYVYRSVPTQSAFDRACNSIFENAFLQGNGPIKRALLVSSSFSRFPEHKWTDWEREYSSDYRFRKDRTDLKNIMASEAFEPSPAIDYKPFFSPLCGINFENDAQILEKHIEEDDFPWVGEILDNCNKASLFDFGLTYRVSAGAQAVFKVLAEKQVPISPNLSIIDCGAINPENWLLAYDNPNSWIGDGQNEPKVFIACGPDEQRFTNLLEVAKFYGIHYGNGIMVPVHINCGQRFFCVVLEHETGRGEEFWERVFTEYPYLNIEMIFAINDGSYSYDPATHPKLRHLSFHYPGLLDFLVGYSEHFSLGSHIATTLDYTPGESIYGDNLEWYKAYWDTVFKQVYYHPNPNGIWDPESGWNAVQNIAHKNVEHLLAIDTIPGYEYSDFVSDGGPAGDDSLCSNLKFNLYQNMPNPVKANKGTVIRYTILGQTNTNIVIYNSLGQRISTLVNEIKDSGVYEVFWGCRDDSGNLVANGVYFYKLQAGNLSNTRKMLVVR